MLFTHPLKFIKSVLPAYEFKGERVVPHELREAQLAADRGDGITVRKIAQRLHSEFNQGQRGYNTPI